MQNNNGYTHQRNDVMSDSEIRQHLIGLNDWSYDGEYLNKEFKFSDYYEVLSFINGTAWISNKDDHHPQIEFGYNTCKVLYRTHMEDGITPKDFIAASKIDRMMS
ncbi:MAG: 4a-hydroxytetrahydrobiopterin dehydratase [Candidatus Omnitrophica bacterium]|nr:4a-hydroxytetrahydrobiopterin dehydratase [Candidatus Omnitrophota bacterium]